MHFTQTPLFTDWPVSEYPNMNARGVLIGGLPQGCSHSNNKPSVRAGSQQRNFQQQGIYPQGQDIIPVPITALGAGAGTGSKYDFLISKIFPNTPIEIMAKEKIVHRMDLIRE